MIGYVELDVFTPLELDKWLEEIYDQYDAVIFIVYFYKVPIHKVRALIPILEKYRSLTRIKLHKTIIHVDSKWERWLAEKLLTLVKPEKSVEIILKSSNHLG